MTLLGVEGAESGSKALESEAETYGERAAKLARAKKRGTAQMARITKQESKMLKDASRLAKGVGNVFAAAEAYDNVRDCIKEANGAK